MTTITHGWPYVGLVFAGIILAVMLLKPAAVGQPYTARFRDPAWLLWITTPMYMFHQFEEHGIDMLGRHFYFLHDMCKTLGHPSVDGCPAEATFILAVNVPLIWIGSPITGWMGTRRVMAGATMLGIPLVNGIAHTVPALVHGTYNPGLFTSIMLFLPVCAWVFYQLFRQGLLDGRRMAIVVGASVVLHGVLMGSLQLTEHGIIGHGVQAAIQVVNGFLPIVVGLLVPNIKRADAQEAQPTGAVTA